MEKLSRFFGIMATLFIFTLISGVINGYVLVTLWKWFVVPTFHLPLLTYQQALGLALVISFITQQDISGLKKENPEQTSCDIVFYGFIQLILSATVAIGSGWLYLQLF